MRRPSFFPPALRGGLATLLVATLLVGMTALVWHARAADMQTLEIATKSGVYTFMVEMADSDETRAKGLMFRKELPEGQGMLFDFKREQEITMWMENTYVSLDMIFIRSDGTILRIAENTEPMSRRVIPSRGPVLSVLEVVAGTARKFGIAPGDRVGHPLFKPK